MYLRDDRDVCHAPGEFSGVPAQPRSLSGPGAQRTRDDHAQRQGAPLLLSVEEYQRLKRRDRRVFAVEDLSPEQIAALQEPLPAGEDDALNAELKDWTP
jgi:hypothetical protein